MFAELEKGAAGNKRDLVEHVITDKIADHENPDAGSLPR